MPDFFVGESAVALSAGGVDGAYGVPKTRVADCGENTHLLLAVSALEMRVEVFTSSHKPAQMSVGIVHSSATLFNSLVHHL